MNYLPQTTEVILAIKITSEFFVQETNIPIQRFKIQYRSLSGALL